MSENSEPLTAEQIAERLPNGWKVVGNPPVATNGNESIYCVAELKRSGKFTMSYIVESAGDVAIKGIGFSPEQAHASFRRVLFAKAESLQEERKALDAKLKAVYGLMEVV